MQASQILHGAVMAGGKLASAATLVGTAQRALEIGIDWAGDRTIKGQPMRERPMFANMIGELARDIEAARSYYFTVNQMLGDPRTHGAIWSPSMVGRTGAARAMAADVTTNTFDKVLQLMGSQG